MATGWIIMTVPRMRENTNRARTLEANQQTNASGWGVNTSVISQFRGAFVWWR